MRIHFSVFSSVLLLFVISCKSYPQGGPDEVEVEMPEPLGSNPSKFKQEETDSDGEEVVTTPQGPNFGSQVAQIITGAVTGNLGSILQGSFNLISDQEVKAATNGAWATIAGITTTTTTTSTTTAAPTTQAPTTTEGTEAPEAETEDTRTEPEVTSTESSDAPDESPSSSAATTNSEDDDDEEEGEGGVGVQGEGGIGAQGEGDIGAQGEGGIEAQPEDSESDNFDTSVYNRSKVLRVV